MELALEGILETLLVGSIASLCLLCSLFLLLPKMIRVQAVRSIFKVLLYEEESVYGQSSSPGRIETGADADVIFIRLLLVAAVYGTGVIAEALSDSVTSSSHRDGILSVFFSSDPEIREASFEAVGRAAVTAGHVAPELAEFMSDYVACRDLPDSLMAHADTCETIFDRAQAFYYTAKNLVFKEQTYFEELSRMQNRIDFTRAVTQSLMLLAFILLIGALVGGFAEWRTERPEYGRDDKRLRARLFGLLTRSTVYKDQLRHWVKLAAIRMLFMSALAALVAYPSQEAWHENEEEFDRRVFGYFLASMASADQSEDALPAISPVSPYRVLGMDVGERFEPSAIEPLGDSKRVLVSNDKGGAEPFVLFDFDETRGFQNPSKVGLGTDVILGKMESLHVEPLPAGGGYRVLAASTFEPRAEGAGGLVSFELTADGVVKNAKNEGLLDRPCLLLSRANDCKIEGLTSRDASSEALLGVRARDGKPHVALLHAKKNPAGAWTTSLLWNGSFPGAPPESGISSLELDKRGNLLVLTTTERNDSPALANQVAGVLWRIPAAQLEAALDGGGLGRSLEPVLVQTFIHKPEGLTVLDSHAILAVFDDDGMRKSRTYAPQTFALDQHESVYTIVRAAAP